MLREAFREGWPEVQPLVPKRVRAEAERYLQCGDVRYGFVEATCQACEVPRLVALRCRGRGWCPSCTTRRALETGLQLEEELPRVRHRQWTLSLPMARRSISKSARRAGSIRMRGSSARATAWAAGVPS